MGVTWVGQDARTRALNFQCHDLYDTVMGCVYSQFFKSEYFSAHVVIMFESK